MPKYALKRLLSIEIYVLCNSLAMCMDITETYDDMIGLRLLLYMYQAEKPHLGDRVMNVTNSCRHTTKVRN